MFTQFPALRSRQACLFIGASLWMAASGLIMTIGFSRQSEALNYIGSGIGLPVFLAVTCVSFPEQNRYFSGVGREARNRAVISMFPWTSLALGCFFGMEQITNGERAAGWTIILAVISLVVLLTSTAHAVMFAFTKGTQPSRCQA